MAKEQTGTFKRQLKVKDLLSVHKKYKWNNPEWKLLLAVYEGIRKIIKMGYIKKHEREPQESYDRRIEELYGLGYSKSVVDIFHFYLFKKEPKRETKSLESDKLWQMFFEDANLHGDSFDTTIMEISLYAGVEGHMGILIDKPKGNLLTRAEQIKNKVYPYIARYFPNAILDWKRGKDEYGKPILEMVKLLDENDQYRIIWVDSWEVWELPKDEDGNVIDDEEAEAVFIDSGINPIGEVPFIWHYNNRSKDIGIGVSDISEIARIDLSIIRNLSQIEEIVNYAAFPMMLKPMRSADPKNVNIPQTDDEVSVQAVQEFDPENPDAKPEWMKTEVADPIIAILEFINKKITEIYRSSNAGGMAATEIQTQAKSGVALKTEFQLLNSKLVGKAINLEQTENRIKDFWLKWEQKERLIDLVNFSRDRTFDIENLASDLENAIVAKNVVVSNKFNELVQKNVARQVLPTASEDDIAEIDNEIEVNVKRVKLIDSGNNGSERSPGNIPNIDKNDLSGVQEGQTENNKIERIKVEQ